MANNRQTTEKATDKTLKNASQKTTKKFNVKELLHIFSFVLPYKVQFAIGLIFLALSSFTFLLFPYITGELVDAATGESNWMMDSINYIALAMMGVLVLQSIFSYLRVVLFAIVSENAMADIRNALYQKIISLPIVFFERNRVGDLVSRLSSDVTQLQSTLSNTLAEFFRQIATLVIGLFFILFISPRLTLVMLSVFPALIIVAIVFGRFIRRLSKKSQDALAEANIVVDETFQAINIVKAFANEKYEAGRYNNAIQSVMAYALKAARYRGVFISFIFLGLFGSIVLVLWYGATLISEGQMTIGQLTSFIIYTTFIGGSMGGMSGLYASIQSSIGASERVRNILEETGEASASTQKENKNKAIINGPIVFDNVNFAYPTRNDVQVLNNINLTIKRGEMVAIVGASGAGKSTIAQLLMRFYETNNGQIFINKTPLTQIDHHNLRSNIAIVPQEVILFGGTIKENIAYGNIDASQQQIIEASQAANAYDFIQSFPDGFDTVVGERGIKLSGGQKQRIAIARAILKNPNILILDEATSSLDAESEQQVKEALEKLMDNRTTIVIAHRLATIRNADKILVLENGTIIETGNHNELLENESGYYNKLIKLQFEVT